MLRCLKDGCPWKCGTRRTPTCGEQIMRPAGLALALLLTLVVTLIWGVMDIGEGHEGGPRSTSGTSLHTRLSECHIVQGRPRCGPGVYVHAADVLFASG